MTQPQKPQKRQLKVERQQDLQANYSNMVMISHTAQEVILDFMQIIPQDNRALVVDRVVMSPTHAKLLLNALKDNIQKFETRFGEVKVPPAPPSLADQLFQNISGTGGTDDEE